MGTLANKRLEELSPDELLEYAKELQLRVGRFLAVEQQLINVRDMLDNEVVIHKRMNSFNEKAFNVSTTDGFLSFIAESVIDIFEFEFGIAVQHDLQENNLVEFAAEGIEIPCEVKAALYKLFSTKFNVLNKKNAIQFNQDEWPELSVIIPFHQFILVNLFDKESHTGIYIAGGVLQKSAKNYHAIEKQRSNAFELFAKEVLSHYISSQKTLHISTSLNRLSSLSESFLKFGTDPLENIKSIIRKACEILNVEFAFYKTQNREKPILHFSQDAQMVFGPGEMTFLNEKIIQASDEVTYFPNWPSAVVDKLNEGNAEAQDYVTVCRKVRLEDQFIGVFGICIPKSFVLGVEQMQIIGIIGAAIAVEKKRFLSGLDLLESEEKYRVIFEGTPHGSMIIQLPKGDIKYVNPSMCKMFRATESDLKSKTFFDLHHPDKSVQLFESLKDIRGNDEIQSKDVPCLKSDGTLFFSDVNALPVTLAGNHFIALFYVDITERKLAQQKLLENNNELTKINSELDNFVYSVSHDLRTPLLAIKGLVDLVDLNQGDSDENVEFIDLIEGSVDRMDETIKEILDYSRNARTAVVKKPIDIRKIVEEAYADMRFFSKHPVKLKMDICENFQFVSDESRINTVLKNLIGNAIKYADDKKEDSFVHVSACNGEGKVVILIADNGEGIPPGSIKSVFDMFYRASNKTTGTGLGLYITKEMVDKLGGNIQIESALKVGTTIKIVLPD